MWIEIVAIICVQFGETGIIIPVSPLFSIILLDKQSLSAVRFQAQAGIFGIEVWAGKNHRAVLQPLQISGLVQCVEVLFIDGNPVLSQLTV